MFFSSRLKESVAFGRIHYMPRAPITVLVIDDEPAVLGTVQVVLRNYGWNVRGSTDGREGMTLAASLHPEVVLCDANLPGLSGSEVIKLLRSDAITMDIPIVLMSGFGHLDLYSQHHSIVFLSKPFGPLELRDAMDAALGLRDQCSGR
jgi:CheY-like chemotaxis protein